VTLDWVSLDAAGAEGTLARLVNATGGSIQRPGPAARWREATLAAVRAAEVIRVSDAAVPIMWRGRLADLGRMTADRANTTFMRGDAEVLAAREDSSAAPMAAEWRVGAGRVAALAFAAPLSVVERVASGIEPSPRDPRFVVKWESDRVTVEAADTVWPLDGLRIEMRRLDAPDAAAVALAQIAPGRYEASIPPSSQPRLLALNVGEQRIDAHAMVGMPEPEFQQTGINRSELERLAQRTGGRVIDADRGPHELLPSPRRRAPLAVPLLLIAVASLAGALVLCHRYGS
jgi:hypothetical protein